MAFEAFKYTVKEEGINRVIDEKGNTMIALREVAWGEGQSKLELRKWKLDGENEIPQKGFSFLTDNGPTELVHVLVEEGYGETKHILNTVKDRDDFQKSINVVMGKESELYDESVGEEVEEIYYDPSDMDLD